MGVLGLGYTLQYPPFHVCFHDFIIKLFRISGIWWFIMHILRSSVFLPNKSGYCRYQQPSVSNIKTVFAYLQPVSGSQSLEAD